ncbi:jg27040, partial [Pararge aegeria aegeria]
VDFTLNYEYFVICKEAAKVSGTDPNLMRQHLRWLVPTFAKNGQRKHVSSRDFNLQIRH